jgi:hypothetical protein
MSCVKAVIRLIKKAESEIETQIEESEVRIRGISDYTILSAAGLLLLLLRPRLEIKGLPNGEEKP